jgi:hypothetical protein
MILFLLAILTLWQVTRFGDYSMGIFTGLALLVFGFFLIITFLYIFIKNIVLTIRKQQSYDAIPLSIMILLACFFI